MKELSNCDILLSMLGRSGYTPSWGRFGRQVLTAVLSAAFLISLAQCSEPLTFGAETKAFVESGLSEVRLGSSVFRNYGTATTVLSSGVEVQVDLGMVNPKNLDVVYTLTWNLPDSMFTKLPPLNPEATSATRLSFTFVLAATAEHRDVVFTLRKFVPSTDKEYDPESFQAVCDSPPNTVQFIKAANDGVTSPLVGFVLPTSSSDDDLVSAQIEYNITGDPLSTQIAVVPLTSLATSWGSGDPLAEYSADLPKRYYQPSGLQANQSYDFWVSLIDARGQYSGALGTNMGAVYLLAYNANAGTGYLPSVLVPEGGSVTVASGEGFTRDGYVFAGWILVIEGLETVLQPGDLLTMNSDVTLYAQWQSTGPGITIEWGAPGVLNFSATALSVSVGQAAVITATMSGGSEWAWYIGGELDSENTGASFSKTFTEPGVYTVSITVYREADNTAYSGSAVITVSD